MPNTNAVTWPAPRNYEEVLNTPSGIQVGDTVEFIETHPDWFQDYYTDADTGDEADEGDENAFLEECPFPIREYVNGSQWTVAKVVKSAYHHDVYLVYTTEDNERYYPIRSYYLQVVEKAQKKTSKFAQWIKANEE